MVVIRGCPLRLRLTTFGFVVDFEGAVAMRLQSAAGGRKTSGNVTVASSDPDVIPACSRASLDRGSDLSNRVRALKIPFDTPPRVVEPA